MGLDPEWHTAGDKVETSTSSMGDGLGLSVLHGLILRKKGGIYEF